MYVCELVGSCRISVCCVLSLKMSPGSVLEQEKVAVAPGGEVNVAAASGSSGCGGEAEPG